MATEEYFKEHMKRIQKRFTKEQLTEIVAKEIPTSTLDWWALKLKYKPKQPDDFKGT